MKQFNKILLIDDDKDCIFYHSQLMQMTHFARNIEVAYNGMDALALLDSCIDYPDLILLDLNMPIMDGWEFLEGYAKLEDRIRTKIHLFVMSTSLNPDDRVKAEQDPNVIDFYTKYLDNQALEEILNRCGPALTSELRK